MSGIIKHPNSVFRKDLESLKSAIRQLRQDMMLAEKAIILLNQKIDKTAMVVEELVDKLNAEAPPEEPEEDPSV